MASNFLYKLRVISKEAGEHHFPVYAFKASHRNWRMMDVLHIADLTRIVLDSDNFGHIDVCTMEGYCHRALIKKTITFFELHIKDANIESTQYAERPTRGTISCKNMNGKDLFSVPRGLINMSVEYAPPTVAAVSLYFEPGSLTKDF